MILFFWWNLSFNVWNVQRTATGDDQFLFVYKKTAAPIGSGPMTFLRLSERSIASLAQFVAHNPITKEEEQNTIAMSVDEEHQSPFMFDTYNSKSHLTVPPSNDCPLEQSKIMEWKSNGKRWLFGFFHIFCMHFNSKFYDFKRTSWSHQTKLNTFPFSTFLVCF